jgi:hypothetical protein
MSGDYEKNITLHYHKSDNNDLANHFILAKEIWIDGQVSCEETEYFIALEMKERQLMTEVKSYSDAIAIPDSLEREAGVIDPDER